MGWAHLGNLSVPFIVISFFVFIFPAAQGKTWVECQRTRMILCCIGNKPKCVHMVGSRLLHRQAGSEDDGGRTKPARMAQ